MDNSLRQSFLELPDAVRDWLTSERVMDAVAELNRDLEYRGDMAGVIPWLITRLAVKDLNPKYFIREFMEYTGEDFDRAKTVTQEIDGKILRRIETQFDRLGIDLNALYLGKELPTETAAESFGAAQDKLTRGITAEVVPAAPSAREQFGVAERKQAPSYQLQEAEGKEEGPVILHAEKDEIKPVTQPPIAPKPKFTITIPKKYTPPVAPPPVTVRIETPDGNHEAGIMNYGTKQAMPTQNELPKIIKVVHYSNFRTPLDPRSVYKGHRV